MVRETQLLHHNAFVNDSVDWEMVEVHPITDHAQVT